MNAQKSPAEWAVDRDIAAQEIIKWLAAYRHSGESRAELEGKIFERLSSAQTREDVLALLTREPEILQDLRSLTRRDLGAAQAANFLGVGKTTYENLELGKRQDPRLAKSAVDLIWQEMDVEIVPWLVEGNQPQSDEVGRAAVIAADRRIRRKSSTELRYLHEPRQLDKLEAYLSSHGLRRVQGGPISNPRVEMEPGTYSLRRSVTGHLSNGDPLAQSVDAIFKPVNWMSNDLPIFLEAKSMTDVVNPNKRQKEEAQKSGALKKAFGTATSEVVFLILLGGTVPERYLEVEAASGIDWVWEHRLSDLDALMKWRPQRVGGSHSNSQ